MRASTDKWWSTCAGVGRIHRMMSAEVLGIGVDEALIARWRDWFAPSVQPFRTDVLPPQVAAAVPMRQVESTPEWADTFFM